MDVGGVGGGGPPIPMGGDNPFAVQQKTVSKPTNEQDMSIGHKLNNMAGVEQEKNLYKPKQEMGKEAFLKLFMEQLKYQDPMNPVKNDQFNQQMAMFSQLEQQVNMNKNLEKMIAAQSNTQIAALQLVGKNVTADRGTLYHEKERFTAMNFKLPQDVKALKVEIKDQLGETVRTFNMEARQQGDVNFKWDGNDDQGIPMPTGKYTYKVSGTALNDKPVTINSKVDGRVSGVTNVQGVTFLLVGEQRIGLNDVEMIKEGTPDGAPAAGMTTAAPATAVVSPTPATKNPPGLDEAMADAMKSLGQKTSPPPAASTAASSESDKNHALSHDSFEEVPSSSDGSTAGTRSESSSSQQDVSERDRDSFDGGMPPMMPIFTR